MTDREIIIHLAEKVMGFTCVGFHDDERKAEISPRLVEQFGKKDGQRDWFLIGKDRIWSPLESIADAFEVQAALKTGQCSRYMDALEKQYMDLFEDCPSTAYLLTVTPRQRCLAIVEATR